MPEQVSIISRVNFRYEIPSISKLNEVWSSEFMVHDIPWSVSIGKRNEEGKQYLAAFLYCTKKDIPPNWKHVAWASFKLLPFSDNQNAIEKHSEPCVFDSTGIGYGEPKIHRME